jgi:hypothetical protein
MDALQRLAFFEQAFDMKTVLLSCAISRCSSRHFLPSILLISSLLMSHRRFLAVCDRQDVETWFRFEAVLLEFVRDFPVVYTMYSDLRHQLLGLL